MNQLYERIRTICEEKNITIGELSRQAKLNDDDQQALKRGRRMNISLGAAKNIARVLGVSIDSLAEYETPNLMSSLSRTQLQQAADAYEAIIRREVVEDRFRERGAGSQGVSGLLRGGPGPVLRRFGLAVPRRRGPGADCRVSV